MPYDFQGILSPTALANQQRNRIDVFAINFMVNRNPLITRVPHVPIGNDTFSIVSRSYRNRTATLAAAITANNQTTLTLDDASPFMVGDILEIYSTAGVAERVQITADPNTSANTIVVSRGQEGTTAVTANDLSANTTIRLLGNARTGGEINQTGIGMNPLTVTQYCQTFQHAVQVAGTTQSNTDIALPPGASTPLDQYKMESLQNVMDDMEVTSFYGLGQSRSSSATGRPTQKGLRTLIVTNRVTTPTNAGAYKPTDFIRDALEPVRGLGGEPTIAFGSKQFITGLATWGQPAVRVEAGATRLGVKIDLFETPFLPGLYFVFSPLLRDYTACVITPNEVRFRSKRDLFYKPRGDLGDAFQGDFISEGAIELGNETHHAWVEGITAFSAT